MKIAFDATVVHGQKSGVGYYTQELLRALVRLETPDEYFVFSHRPLSSDVVAPVDGVRLSDRRFCPVRALYLHAMLPGLLNQENPDLVHYTNFLAPIGESRPYVLTVHDMSLERLRGHHPIGKRIYTRRLIPHTARRARLILTNSEFSKWDIVRFLGIPEDRIRVTPLAASELFTPTEARVRARVLGKYRLDRPYCLYVGNIEPRKNLERLVEAFGAVSDNDHLLVIAGNAWFKGNRVVRKVAALGLERRVRFVGYVPRRDLPLLMGGATAFVYPSLLEGFGLPVLEAMACRVPVITSAGSSLAELAGGGAMLVDPFRTDDIAAALERLIEDRGFRENLAAKSLARAADYSWQRTAEQTQAAYEEIAQGRPPSSTAVSRPQVSPARVRRAVTETLDYAAQFDYPLTLAELRERLFDLQIGAEELSAALKVSGVMIHNGYVTEDPAIVNRRLERERRSDRVIEEFWPHVRTLGRFPFVRMLAFSGATSHRNMTDRDLDLFAVVEDGKLWAVLLCVTVWAKARGLRENICLNYLISDRALPLFETDTFTAQQVASLRPVYGREVYDRFVSVNPFVGQRFPNFDRAKHRDFYDEIDDSWQKRFLESALRCGPIQVLEAGSRWVLRRYLERKWRRAEARGDTAVLLGRKWIKLHLQSHKEVLLKRMAEGSPDTEASARDTVTSLFAPSLGEREQQNVKVKSE